MQAEQQKQEEYFNHSESQDGFGLGTVPVQGIRIRAAVFWRS